MEKRAITSLLSVFAIATLTIGCGGSSATKKTTTGTVIDDYIQGATVCVDTDNNGELNTAIDTPCAVGPTNSTGQFSFASDVSGSPLVMSGGTDVGTGEAFTGSYTAPAGSTVINPLTTVVQAVVNAGNSVDAAQNIVKTSLGLPNVDLTSYDPIAALDAALDSAGAEDDGAAKEILAQQTNIQTILTTVSQTVAATSTTVSESNVTDEAADQIAAIMLATPTPTEINVTDDSNVETILTQTAQEETSETIDTTVVAAIADQVEATATEVTNRIENSTSTSLGEIRQEAAQINEVVDNNAGTIATAIESNTDASTIVSTVEAETNTLTTDVDDAASDVTSSDNLTTVATEETTPFVTGAEGGN